MSRTLSSNRRRYRRGGTHPVDLAAPVGAFRSEPRLRRGSPLLGEVREGAAEAPSR